MSRGERQFHERGLGLVRLVTGPELLAELVLLPARGPSGWNSSYSFLIDRAPRIPEELDFLVEFGASRAEVYSFMDGLLDACAVSFHADHDHARGQGWILI